MFEVLMYDGGVYRSNEILELIEDIGGTVIQQTRSAQIMTITMSIPGEDRPAVETLCRSLGGVIKNVPLAGTEIAVVGPSLGRHHMPHPICDIAEQLRQYGAITVVMGLARGRGKATSQIMEGEIGTIQEYDAAIFVLGNFKTCIESKKHLFERIDIPVVLVTGPMPEGLDEDCEAIVSGVGRRAERMRLAEDRKLLDDVSSATQKVLEQKRRTIEEDPLFVHPAELKKLLEEYPPIADSLRPAPMVLHMDGLRLKIPFGENRDAISELKVYGRRLGDISRIMSSKINDSSMIIKIMTSSEVGDLDRAGR